MHVAMTAILLLEGPAFGPSNFRTRRIFYAEALSAAMAALTPAPYSG